MSKYKSPEDGWKIIDPRILSESEAETLGLPEPRINNWYITAQKIGPNGQRLLRIEPKTAIPPDSSSLGFQLSRRPSKNPITVLDTRDHK